MFKQKLNICTIIGNSNHACNFCFVIIAHWNKMTVAVLLRVDIDILILLVYHECVLA